VKVKRAGQYGVLDFPPVQDDWDFWPMWADGRWETGTRDVIKEYVPGRKYVDIGAWVGPTVLWAHRYGATAIRAYEPDPVAFGVLRTNVLLNNLDVICKPQAVALQPGVITLQSTDFGESETGIQPGHKIQVPAVSVEEACAGAEFVKVDIEGAEHGLLHQLAKVGCPMLISVHPPWWPDQEPDFSGWSETIGVEDGGGFGEVLCLP
jgi:FkbM family methyltransferase